MKTRKQLEQEIVDLKAQLLCYQKSAYTNVNKAANLMGSACIVQISSLGGRVICEPFAIADGLSEETVQALKSDIKRSIDLSISLNSVK